MESLKRVNQLIAQAFLQPIVNTVGIYKALYVTLFTLGVCSFYELLQQLFGKSNEFSLFEVFITGTACLFSFYYIQSKKNLPKEKFEELFNAYISDSRNGLFANVSSLLLFIGTSYICVKLFSHPEKLENIDIGAIIAFTVILAGDALFFLPFCRFPQEQKE